MDTPLPLPLPETTPSPAEADGAGWATDAATTADGIHLALRRWILPPGTPARADVLVIHGYMEHGSRYAELASALGRHGIRVAAPDLRGHGHSAGRRGHVLAFDEYLEDVTTVFATLGPGPRFLLGHSMGGLVAARFLLARQPACAGLILTSPYLRRALPVPAWKLAVGHLLGRLAPRVALPTGLAGDRLTHDADLVERHARDPLIFHTATAGWFRAVTATQDLTQRCAAIPIPVLMLLAESDVVADAGFTQRFAERLQCPDKTVRLLAGLYHEVLNEVDRVPIFNEIAAWVIARC